MPDDTFRQQFQQFIVMCTEDYLIRYGNKGLYKRACKELEQGITVMYEHGEQAVSCILSEGTACSLSLSPEHWKCSCPADTLCKHVLIAILYYQRHCIAIAEPEAADAVLANTEQTAQALREPAEGYRVAETRPPHAAPAAHNTERRFAWLLTTELGLLLRPFTASVIEEVWFRLRYPMEIEVKHDTLLTVNLTDHAAEVSFTAEPDPSKALCSVKQREGELLRLEALLRYRAAAGLDDQAALAEEASAIRYSRSAVTECRLLLLDMLRSGLARLPRSFAARLETMAVAAHSGNLPEVERSLRAIHGELQLFWERHVRFSLAALLGRITRLLLRLELLQQQLPAVRLAELAGQFRSKYYTVPKLKLYSLGAEPWETLSGYRGITYYLYCSLDRRIYTYSDVRPVYYEDQTFTYHTQYAAASPWLPELAMRHFAASELQFEQVKVNEEGRISSGEGARLSVLPRTKVEVADLAGCLSVCHEETTGFEPDYALFTEPRPQFKLLKLNQLEKPVYDKPSESLVIAACREDGSRVEMKLPYATEWKQAIQRMERGFGFKVEQPVYALVQMERNKGMRPISLLQGRKVLNLKLDM
ncbi:hypothetical protein [Paenibacillus sp. SYP-B4298]|uniref:hypothetical protein n=1 Tax=Paenibacillus sp. SYP-B4298 TaxID=2996034 RepID=UPI0022DE5B6C|nr:hypothetical protein [Paenibacillus sp. SYP-B4298]